MSALINVCNKQAWKASAAKETNRLSSDNKTSEWNLAGGIILEKRTRGKKQEETRDNDQYSFGENEENNDPADSEESPKDYEQEEEELSAAPPDNNNCFFLTARTCCVCGAKHDATAALPKQ